MKIIDALSADYWLENTSAIQESDLHISCPVMDAYTAGFKKALEMAAKVTKYDEILEIGQEDDGNGPSLYDQFIASKKW